MAALGAATLGATPAWAGARAPADTSLGARLYDIVKAYSRWPVHRTGTDTEAAALDWFQSELRQRGAKTSRWDYSYPRYEWTAQVRVAGRTAQTIPLYYEGVGEVSSDKPFVRSVTISDTGGDAEVLAAVKDAKADNARLAVLPVFNANRGYPTYDGLVADNRDPAAATTGVPTLFIPGRLADQAARDVQAHLSARIVNDRSHDITGWFGKPVADPIVVTTPLSGWFTCAAERGSGIAVALELAADLARTHPVFFLGNSGHELNNFGARAYLQDAFELRPTAVFHIGASIAAGGTDTQGHFGLVPRVVASNPPVASVPGLAEAVQLGNFVPTPTFPGEGAVWSQKLGSSVPLLSFAGQFPQFHTPDDRPGVATDPSLLDTAYRSVRGAAQALLGA
ncbi:hypothetical protein GCM10023322_06070 [Rugosimonospora acidiphila]|uniref:Peptidase M28 domain-containing protein n=1 Tax=Rugosimonospora acidiphila TaxID=556531 RepID=A0ABP9RIW7_9ACTN